MWLRLFIFFYFFIAVLLVGAVLLQPGKGFGFESAQGSGSSATVFGSAGPIATLRRASIWLFSIFAFLTLALCGTLSRTQRNLLVQLEVSEEQRQLEDPELGFVPLDPHLKVEGEEGSQLGEQPQGAEPPKGIGEGADDKAGSASDQSSEPAQ